MKLVNTISFSGKVTFYIEFEPNDFLAADLLRIDPDKDIMELININSVIFYAIYKRMDRKEPIVPLVEVLCALAILIDNHNLNRMINEFMHSISSNSVDIPILA